MRTSLLALVLLASLAGCKKKLVAPSTPVEPPPVEMQVIALNNVTAGRQEPRVIDIDGNGTADVTFVFMLVGDPLMQADKYQFYASGGFYTSFPVNTSEEMPMLQSGQEIGNSSFPGFEWYNASAIMLAQKVITMSNPPYWTGAWKNSSHAYFPFYILKGDKKYFGWFEISFDTTLEKVILHRAAVAKQPEKVVKAGAT